MTSYSVSYKFCAEPLYPVKCSLSEELCSKAGVPTSQATKIRTVVILFEYVYHASYIILHYDIPGQRDSGINIQSVFE